MKTPIERAREVYSELLENWTKYPSKEAALNPIQSALAAQQAESDARIKELEVDLSAKEADRLSIARLAASTDAKYQAAVKELEAYKLRVGIKSIFRICEACGHDQDKDGQCANCMKAFITEVANAHVMKSRDAGDCIKSEYRDDAKDLLAAFSAGLGSEGKKGP